MTCEKRCVGLGNDWREMCASIAKNVVRSYAAKTSASQPAKTADSRSWREVLRNVTELAQGQPGWIVEDFLIEGVTFIGSLAGVGKTWLALALAKAIVNGTKFLGNFNVPKRRSVIYLCPEMGAKAFRRRCEKLGLVGSDFWCMTIADGSPLPLNSEILASAVADLKPA
jgi:RecA-family ATPase